MSLKDIPKYFIKEVIISCGFALKIFLIVAYAVLC